MSEEDKKRGIEFINSLIKCMELHKKHTDLVSSFLQQRESLTKEEVVVLRKLVSTVSSSQGLVVKALHSVVNEQYKYN
jgi:hypothetical protein